MSFLGSASSRRRLLRLALALLPLCALLWWVDRRLAFAGLFLRFEGERNLPALLVNYRSREVSAEDWRLLYGQRGRLFMPVGGASHGVLLVHGMHPQGIDEPRMLKFAKALASSGVAVGTPELRDLMHFRMSRADVVAVANAAKQLSRELGGRKVTVFGVSFGGGLALRAACEPDLAQGMGNLIALGAPADLRRVARFALGEKVKGPDGKVFPLEPHPYARKAMLAFFLGEAGLVADDGPALRAHLPKLLSARAAELEEISPVACTKPIQVPVHLVHGLGDNVIPYTETLWLKRSLKTERGVDALVSPAISHADYAPPTPGERFQLIEFMAKAADW